jgi:sugar phosphate isomerase/epimerase
MHTHEFYRCQRNENGVIDHNVLHYDQPLLRWLTEVNTELGSLFRHYGADVVTGQIQSAPCPTWRDERVLRSGSATTSDRFALRIHIFENANSVTQTSGKNTPNSYSCGESSIRKGRYLGFISLRPSHNPSDKSSHSDNETKDSLMFHYTLRAELAPPRRMLRPQYHIILTSESALRSGIPNFRGSVFGVADTKEKPSICLHYSISEALNLIMIRFGCYPVSERGFSARLWFNDWHEKEKLGLAGKSLHAIQQEGVTLLQALDALKMPKGVAPTQTDLAVGGFVAEINHNNYGSLPAAYALATDRTNVEKQPGEFVEKVIKLEGLICIHDLIANGLPVIMYSDERFLIETSKELRNVISHESQCSNSEPEDRSKHLHATTILGMHLLHSNSELKQESTIAGSSKPVTWDLISSGLEQRQDYSELPGRLICHDSFLGPYTEWDSKTILHSAYSASQITKEQQKKLNKDFSEGLYFMVLGPKEMDFDIATLRASVTQYILASSPHNLREDIKRNVVSVEPGRYDWVTFINKFRPNYIGETSDTHSLLGHLRFVTRFLGTSEMCHRYFCGEQAEDQIKASIEKELKDEPEKGTRKYWWCVEVHLSHSIKSVPAMILFWRSRLESNPQIQRSATGKSVLGVEPWMYAYWKPSIAPALPIVTTSNKSGATSSMESVEGDSPDTMDLYIQGGKEPDEPIEFVYALNSRDAGNTVQVVSDELDNKLSASQSHQFTQDGSTIVLPEVSLITSWNVPLVDNGDLPGVTEALKHQVSLLDLYFLNKTDIVWYRNCLEMSGVPAELQVALNSEDPTVFAAALNADHLKTIASELCQEMNYSYEGPLIGPRPSFTSMATWFSDISSLAEGRRKRAVLAVKNAMHLAALLGCSVIEIVAGAGIPDPINVTGDLPNDDMTEPEWKQHPGRYREARLKQLAQSLKEILENLPSGLEMPQLALEIEPGPAFLLNHLDVFGELLIGLDENIRNKVKLNVDIAHLMLAEHSADDLRATYSKQEDGISICFRDSVAHFHISDHHITHSADVCPGTFHFFEDYEPWLRLAIELREEHQADFPVNISVEMEACNDIHEATRAIAKTRRWLNTIASERSQTAEFIGPRGQNSTPFHGNLTKTSIHQGVILTVDIVNIASSFKDNPLEFERTLKFLCNVILHQRGEILAYTGNGFIAFFRRSLFETPKDSTLAAIEAVQFMLGQATPPWSHQLNLTTAETSILAKLKITAALHYGDIYIPTGGQLKYQALGFDVVCANWLSTILKDFDRDSQPMSLKSATQSFMQHLPEWIDDVHFKDSIKFATWKKIQLDGNEIQLYLQGNRIARDS